MTNSTNGSHSASSWRLLLSALTSRLVAFGSPAAALLMIMATGHAEVGSPPSLQSTKCRTPNHNCTVIPGPIHPNREPALGDNLCASQVRLASFEIVKKILERMIISSGTGYKVGEALRCEQVREFKMPGTRRFSMYRVSNVDYCKDGLCYTFLLDRLSNAIAVSFDSNAAYFDVNYNFLVIESIDKIISNKFQGASARYIFSTKGGDIFVSAPFGIPIVGIDKR